MMMSLQQRLAEESPVLSAGEGLTPEQRMLIRERELTAQIKTLTDERDNLRDELLEHWRDTGEKVSTGAYRLEPIKKETKTYNTAKFVEKFPDFKSCLKVDGTLVAAYEKNGQLPGIEECRTVETKYSFNVKTEVE
jgi:hypothetical protein